MTDTDFKYLVLLGLSIMTSLLALLVTVSSPSDKAYTDSLVREYSKLLQDSLKK